MSLPPYDHDAPCPKCRFMAGTTDYHDGYHGVPCASPDAAAIAGYWNSRARQYSWGPVDKEIQKQQDANDAGWNEKKKAIPEHFDRTCPNCKYLWAEAPR